MVGRTPGSAPDALVRLACIAQIARIARAVGALYNCLPLSKPESSTYLLSRNASRSAANNNRPRLAVDTTVRCTAVGACATCYGRSNPLCAVGVIDDAW